MSIIYKNLTTVKDPLLYLKPIKHHNIKNGSMVRIKTEDGIRTGQVLSVSREIVVIQVIEGTFGIGVGAAETEISFLDETFEIGVSR